MQPKPFMNFSLHLQLRMLILTRFVTRRITLHSMFNQLGAAAA